MMHRVTRGAASSPHLLCMFVIVLASVGPANAQSDPASRLFQTVWTDGAAAAISQYGQLSDPDRPGVLLRVIDDLLWTGKHAEALALLDTVRDEEPERTQIHFQRGRAHLQRGELSEAQAAFARGLAVIDADRTMPSDERESLRRRLDNRLLLLGRSDEQLRRIGAYESATGRTFLFKFDPYINTFPSLLDFETGFLRVLYPIVEGGFYWSDPDGNRVGTVTFEDSGSDRAELVIRTSEGAIRAREVELGRETMQFGVGTDSIEGTLFLPAAPGPVSAIVLTHGAGLSTRYNLVNEALAFARAGIAALVFDKPGLGRSRGENWLLLSIEEQTAHLLEAVERLDDRSDIASVGVWGFSQGGWVAPLAATRSNRVAFVVVASGAAVGPQEQGLQAIRLRMRRAGLSTADVEAATAHVRELWTRVNSGATLEDLGDLYAQADAASWGDYVPRLRMGFELDWWSRNEVSAGHTLESLTVPVLAILGENDEAVPVVDNVPLLALHLAAAPTGDYTIVVLPEANHQFMIGDAYQPLYFSTMVDWVANRFVPLPSN